MEKQIKIDTQVEQIKQQEKFVAESKQIKQLKSPEWIT